nr:hypothetical protein [Tanacetum cinerariifolium]
MRDEHLDNILATESDEFIKSSVENLVPNPSESEGEHECDVPACDDFNTSSNILFDADYDFSSSDDESLSDEDISKKIYSNPLFNEEIISIKIDPHHFNAESDLIESMLNHDSLIIFSFSKIDYLLDEFTEEYDSKNSNAAIESFSPSPIPVEDSDRLMEEINLFLASDGSIPPGIDNDYSDSERDHLFLERLLHDDLIPLPNTHDFSNVVRFFFTSSPIRILYMILQVFLKILHKVLYISTTNCCYECGDQLDGIFCKRRAYKSCGKGAHIRYNFPPKVSVISNPEPCKNQTVDELPQTFLSSHPTCYSGDKSPFTCDSNPNYVDDSSNVFNPPLQPPVYSCEFCGNDASYGHYCTPQVLFIYPEPCYNQDFNFSQDFHDFQQQYLCCENCGDEFIKSSVKNIIPNLSEFEGEHECDVPACDDFTTSSNILLDADYDFSSSDDESFSDEDILKKIYSNPLFDEEIISMKIDLHHFNDESDLIESMLNHDSSIISSFLKIDYLLDDFSGELILLKLIPPGIDKADYDPKEEIRLVERLLYDNSSPRAPEEYDFKNSVAGIESFSPSPIPVEDSDPLMEEIDLFLACNGSIPLCNDNDYSDSERDNLFLERLLHDDPIPFSNTHDFSNVVRVFLPFFTYPVTSSILLSSGSEDTIFDPGISNYHFFSLELGVSHWSGTFMKFNVYRNHLNESPMKILSSTCFPIDH